MLPEACAARPRPAVAREQLVHVSSDAQMRSLGRFLRSSQRQAPAHDEGDMAALAAAAQVGRRDEHTGCTRLTFAGSRRRRNGCAARRRRPGAFGAYVAKSGGRDGTPDR